MKWCIYTSHGKGFRDMDMYLPGWRSRRHAISITSAFQVGVHLHGSRVCCSVPTKVLSADRAFTCLHSYPAALRVPEPVCSGL